jgi:hypothetical protein
VVSGWGRAWSLKNGSGSTVRPSRPELSTYQARWSSLVIDQHESTFIRTPDAGRRLLSALTARQRAQLAAALEVLADELDGRGAQRTGFSA